MASKALPTTPWNYGLEIDPAKPEASVEVVKKDWPLTPYPFAQAAAPIELKAKARKIPEWGFDRFGLCAVLQTSQAQTNLPLETVTLIPMGRARLRISAFPTVSASPDAREWEEAPRAGEP